MGHAYIGTTDAILSCMFKYDANAHVVKWRAVMSAYGNVEAYRKRMAFLKNRKVVLCPARDWQLVTNKLDCCTVNNDGESKNEVIILRLSR